jgi:hypothetical protein
MRTPNSGTACRPSAKFSKSGKKTPVAADFHLVFCRETRKITRVRLISGPKIKNLAPDWHVKCIAGGSGPDLQKREKRREVSS